jgi:hypothetical protein
MHLTRSLFLCALLAGGLALAQAEPSPDRSASCVAALKVRAEPLAQRLRQGDAAVEAELLPVVTDSFAFIGSSYKQGIESGKATEMMKAAEARQAQLPPAELAKIQDGCQLEGKQLLAQASAFERMFINRAARNRIDKYKRTQ